MTRWHMAPLLAAALTAAGCATPAGREADAPLASAAQEPGTSPGTPQVPADTGAFDAARAWEHLQQQVARGPRPAGSQALEDTRTYLRQQLEGFGIAVRDQAFDAATPIGMIRMVNLIATIPGARQERIVLASHYDTKRFSDFRFVGASDGASSTAVVLELGRVLAERDQRYTYELLFLDGEEATRLEWSGTDNTYGSRHYVAEAQQDSSLANLGALILLDMVGDRDLTIRRETTSTTWLTDIIWATSRELGFAGEFLDQRTAVEDDHYPFLRAGVPAIDIIDLDYSAWHTAEDDLGNVSPRSLDVVGRVVLEALPRVEAYLSQSR